MAVKKRRTKKQKEQARKRGIARTKRLRRTGGIDVLL